MGIAVFAGAAGVGRSFRGAGDLPSGGPPGAAGGSRIGDQRGRWISGGCGARGHRRSAVALASMVRSLADLGGLRTRQGDLLHRIARFSRRRSRRDPPARRAIGHRLHGRVRPASGPGHVATQRAIGHTSRQAADVVLSPASGRGAKRQTCGQPPRDVAGRSRPDDALDGGIGRLVLLRGRHGANASRRHAAKVFGGRGCDRRRSDVQFLLRNAQPRFLRSGPARGGPRCADQ